MSHDKETDAAPSLWARLSGGQAKQKLLAFASLLALILICAVGDDAWGQIDCTLAAQNLMLAAHGKGLGSCWIGFAQGWLETAAGRAALDLPANWTPVAPIIVGHPAAAASAPPRTKAEVRWCG